MKNSAETQITNNETKIKTRKTLPEVFYSDAVLKSIETNEEANNICIHVIGSIAMNQTGGTTGFNGRNVFVTYNKQRNALIAQTYEEILFNVNK